MLIKHFASDSKGNLYTIDEDIIIDCGVSFSFIDATIDFQSFGYLLLTHEHADHLNKVSLRKVFTRSNLIIVCGEWLNDILLSHGFDESRIIVVEFGKVYQLGEYKISPIKAYHDVENCGYRIMKDGHKHLHITDTATLDGIDAFDYDTATIECNHDEQKALELIAQAKENGEFTHLKGAMNSHLSVQQTIQFCERNRIKQLYPAHIGSSTKKEVIEALRRWV
ncbi:MAG: hypothetical protein EOL93_09455 [Epsilonproteobacteria bacterium]|nr:hypothetical protein [Campylobacterota bacterium]